MLMKSQFVFLLLFCNFLSFSQSLESSKIDTLFPKTRISLNSLEDYISTNFVYPEDEIQDIIDTVWVSFSVNVNGTIKDVVVLKGLTELIDKEAIRVIEVLPSFTFIPLEKNGQYLNQTYCYPIKVNGRGVNKYNTIKVYDSDDLDVVPEYGDGLSELSVFIQQNFTIPIESIEMGEQCCSIWLEFIIEIDGRVSNVKILKSESLSLGKEGIRVVKLLDNWNPGMKDGVKVRSYYSIPIKS